MSDNLSEGWRRLGCDVHECFYGSHMGKSWDAEGVRASCQTNADLIETVKRLRSENRLDLVFCVIYDDVLKVETIRQLCRLGIPLVNYHVDLVGQWHRILRTGRYFDLTACAHEDHWTGLKRAGIRPYYLPMAANPPTDIGPADSAFEYEGIRYLGSPWSYRYSVLSELIRQNFPMQIYGNNWGNGKRDASNTHHWRKNLHDLQHYAWPLVREEGWRSLWSSFLTRFNSCNREQFGAFSIPPEVIKGRYRQEDFESLVQGAAINLGFTHFRGKPGTSREQRQVRLREFEIPMCGGFYLTQDCAQLRSLYQVGQHLETWNDVGELSDKIRYYLTHPAQRTAIATSGREYALKRHTWQARFRGLLKELGITPPGPQLDKESVPWRRALNMSGSFEAGAIRARSRGRIGER